MSAGDAPLEGLLVLDFSQFLSGPSAALRLSDLGARVIKIERPGAGDICRSLYLSDTELGGDSTLFHAINRGKEGFAANLRDADDVAAVKGLIARADVMIQNFRPGVIERLGLGYDEVRLINPRLVYGSISGYGEDGPWAARPGQDLLVQAASGAMWLSGDDGDGPVPFGLSIADALAGHALVEGILAALIRRGVSGKGAHVRTSLLEAAVDLQFEVLTTHLNDGGRQPARAAERNAHAYLAAPYGVYQAADGWLALAMTPLAKLAPLLDLPELTAWADVPDTAFTERDAIKRRIAARLVERSAAEWMAAFETAGVWAAPVLDWPQLLASDAFRRLGMLQTVSREDGVEVRTTRAPIRLDGRRALDDRAAPRIGEHTRAIKTEFGL